MRANKLPQDIYTQWTPPRPTGEGEARKLAKDRQSSYKAFALTQSATTAGGGSLQDAFCCFFTAQRDNCRAPLGRGSSRRMQTTGPADACRLSWARAPAELGDPRAAVAEIVTITVWKGKEGEGRRWKRAVPTPRCNGIRRRQCAGPQHRRGRARAHVPRASRWD